jgi:hypothetical protein
MTAPSAEEVRRYLCYELKWMLRAVVRFEELTSEHRASDDRSDASSDPDLVAWQDSALLHARNLAEFAAASSDPTESHAEWALSGILGTHTRKVPGNLSRFLNNWVVHIGGGSASESKWPKALDGNAIAPDDNERLSKVAEVVFKVLKPKHRTTTLQTEEGAAYVELLERARDYFEQRTPEAFAALTCDGLPMRRQP